MSLLYTEVEKRLSQLIWSGKIHTKEYWRLVKIRAKLETFKTKER
jgi:hypothetical protein